MTTSVFDLFKPNIGPSSSRTVDSMVAAKQFVTLLGPDLSRVERGQGDII